MWALQKKAEYGSKMRLIKSKKIRLFSFGERTLFYKYSWIPFFSYVFTRCFLPKQDNSFTNNSKITNNKTGNTKNNNNKLENPITPPVSTIYLIFGKKCKNISEIRHKQEKYGNPRKYCDKISDKVWRKFKLRWLILICRKNILEYRCPLSVIFAIISQTWVFL